MCRNDLNLGVPTPGPNNPTPHLGCLPRSQDAQRAGPVVDEERKAYKGFKSMAPARTKKKKGSAAKQATAAMKREMQQLGLA